LLGDAVPDPSILRALVLHDYEPLDPSLLPDLPAITDLPAILRGRPGSAAIAQAQYFLSANLDASPMIVDLSMIEGGHDAAAQIARGLCREVALSGRPMIVDVRMCSGDTPVIAIVSELMDLEAPVIIVSDNRRDLGTWTRRAITLPLPTAQQRAQWWRTLRPDADPALAQIATHVDPEDLARMDAADGNSVLVARARGGQRKSRVTTVTPSVRLQDVVLDGLPAQQLSELVDRVRYRATVLDEWKMRPGGTRGRGVTALFAGESGTGKSMSAEALAGELNVPLFSVDLASIVDKYIGETEKNLEEVFRAVENEDGVLLFDEADALFGKRSDVSDARDRYANIEVAYLLQRIESFDGLAILTTNLRANLDEAFQRRLDMIVDFPEPDTPARTAIWAKALAGFPGAFTQEDLETLAILDITGGYIRAAAISAAYKAAAQGQTVMRTHVLAGVKDEWRKSGRLNFPEHAFAGWSDR
jgi:AAA+ superfamily predicted ATPase